MKLSTTIIVILTLVISIPATLARERAGHSGAYMADQLPHNAEPAWQRYSGTAQESIEDGTWIVRQPNGFDRRIDFGPIVERENQENVVEIRWGTNCQDNLNAHGFYISAQGKYLLLHPIHRPNGKDLLLTCSPQGIRPGLIAAHVDLSALPEFDARRVNTYRVRWVTDADNQFSFELSVNGVSIAQLPGRSYQTAPRSLLSLEFRAGDHTIDEISWQLSQGGDPIPDRRLERARQLVTDGRRQLFLDDVMISRLDGLERKIGCPEKYKGNPVIRHHQKPWQRFRAQLYGTCLYFPEDKIFKMWYLAGPRFPWKDPVNINGLVCCPNFQLLAYAESKDGFDWELPVLGLMEFNGSRENNLCRISRENAEGVAVVYDPGDADPHRRYKAFYWEHDFSGPRKFDPATPVSGMSVSRLTARTGPTIRTIRSSTLGVIRPTRPCGTRHGRNMSCMAASALAR